MWRKCIVREDAGCIFGVNFFGGKVAPVNDQSMMQDPVPGFYTIKDNRVILVSAPLKSYRVLSRDLALALIVDVDDMPSAIENRKLALIDLSHFGG
jgi:hypothetical protein